MALEIRHLRNCFDSYKKGKLPISAKWLRLGYMEACLVQFGAIESKDNGLEDYVLTKPNGQTENREEILVRITQQFLNSQKQEANESI